MQQDNTQVISIDVAGHGVSSNADNPVVSVGGSIVAYDSQGSDIGGHESSSPVSTDDNVYQDAVYDAPLHSGASQLP